MKTSADANGSVDPATTPSHASQGWPDDVIQEIFSSIVSSPLPGLVGLDSLAEMLDQEVRIRRQPRLHRLGKMLSGEGVFELWERHGRIDGAIDTEEGPIAFEHGQVCRPELDDVQSGPIGGAPPVVERLNETIRSLHKHCEPAEGLMALGETWICLDDLREFVRTEGVRLWHSVCPAERKDMLCRLPEGFAEFLRASRTGPSGAREGHRSAEADTDHSWINEAVRLEEEGSIEESLDMIFDTIDDWLLDGRFEECSSFLRVLEVETLTTPQLLTILTATLPARSALGDREEFFVRVRTTLQDRGEAADALLSGLNG